MAKATNINNIELDISDRVRYTINGNADKCIELNPNDVGIISRLGESIPKINELSEKYESLMLNTVDDDNNTDEHLMEISKTFRELDTDIRNIVNAMFDADVCSVLSESGTMFDLKNGEYKFYVIISTLLQLYSSTITTEIELMAKKISKRTAKYTNDHNKKKR